MKIRLLTSRHSAWLPFMAALVLLKAPAATAADYPTTVLEDNPVGYYRFEDSLGATSLVDSSASTNNAIVTYTNLNTEACSPVLEHMGLQTKAVYFNGSATNGVNAGKNGTIDVPFRWFLAPTNTFGILTPDGKVKGGPFSIECWTRSFVNRTDRYEGIVASTSQYKSSMTPKWGGWILGKDNASRFNFTMRNGSVFNGPVPVLLQWYHLVGTFDGTNASFYINGVKVAGSTNETDNAKYVASNWDGTSRPANIGNSRYSDNPWMGYNGEVDEVAFYTNALSADRILEHYQVGLNSIVLPPQPPVILQDLTNVTCYANTPVTLSVSAGGDLPLSYQWLRGGVPIDGATNSTLKFTNSYPADNGATFSVSITNPSGTTNSSVATLTLLTDLLVASCPDGSQLQSIVRNVGSYAAFRPVVYGAQPIGYQWYKDGVLLPGQTSATLWRTNVQMADNGASFSVQVTNPWNSTTLSAYLYVQSREVTVPLTGYAAIVAADRPVAYWRLNEPAYSYTAVDAVGTFNGSIVDINSGAGVFTWEQTPGIPSETDLALNITNGAILSVPYAPELNPETAWSAETWVQPSEVSNNPNVNYVIFSSEYNHSKNVYNDWNGWYVTHGSARNFNFYVLPTGSSGIISASPNDAANANQIVAGHWYHLVVSKDSTSFKFYINGELRATRPVATTTFVPNGTGIRPEDSIVGQGATMIGSLHDRSRTPFAGNVDDTAFYNYALSQQQVLTHYLNSTNIAPPEVTVKLEKQVGKVVLSWSQGTLQSAPAVTGPYTDIPSATSPYTNTVGSSTFFRVKVQ